MIMQKQDNLNSTTPLFDKNLKSARIKSGLIAIIPAVIFLIEFSISPPFENAIFPKLMALLLWMGIPSTLIYQFVFCLGFGKKLLPELFRRRGCFEPRFYLHLDTTQLKTLDHTKKGDLNTGVLIPVRYIPAEWITYADWYTHPWNIHHSNGLEEDI